MEVKIEVDDNLKDCIVIKCNKIDSNIDKINEFIKSLNNVGLSFYKNEVECFFNINDILFFETLDNSISAHTVSDIYKVKYKLYELENILPSNFIRISKSTIININHIYSVDRSITYPVLVSFYKSHKQVYVSRFYYKNLKIKMKERK